MCSRAVLRGALKYWREDGRSRRSWEGTTEEVKLGEWEGSVECLDHKIL